MKEYKRLLTEVEAMNFVKESKTQFQAAREAGGLHPRVTWERDRIPKYRLRDLEDYLDAKRTAESRGEAEEPEVQEAPDAAA